MDMEQYKELFLEELEEQLQIMDRELLRLEREGESEEGVQNLFRAAHTIKGSSAAMGMEAIKNLTHEMEQVLEEIRSRRLRVTSELIDLMFACLDHLKEIRDDFDQHEGHAVREQLIRRLKAAVGDRPAAKKNASAATETAGKEDAPWPDVTAATDSGGRTYEVAVALDPACEMKVARCMVIRSKLEQHARVTACRPAPEDELDDAAYETFVLVCESDLNAAQIKNYLASLMDVRQVEITETGERTGEAQSVFDPPPSPSSANASPSAPGRIASRRPRRPPLLRRRTAWKRPRSGARRLRRSGSKWNSWSS